MQIGGEGLFRAGWGAAPAFPVQRWGRRAGAGCLGRGWSCFWRWRRACRPGEAVSDVAAIWKAPEPGAATVVGCRASREHKPHPARHSHREQVHGGL